MKLQMIMEGRDEDSESSRTTSTYSINSDISTVIDFKKSYHIDEQERFALLTDS